MKKIAVLILVTFAIPFTIINAGAKTIGVLMAGDSPYYIALQQGLSEELEKQGLGPGVYDLLVQKPAPATMAWKNAARKIVILEAEVIVALGSAAAINVIEETNKIPVVFASVSDPAGLGISGGNVTGLSAKMPIEGLLKSLKRIATFSKLGVVYSKDEKETVKQVEEVEKYGAQLGFATVRFDFDETAQGTEFPGVDALLLTTSCAANMAIGTVSETARAAKIPVASLMTGGEEKGILLTLSGNPQAQGKAAAQMVASVLKGTKPSAIPVDSSTKPEMILNLHEAKALGLNIPFDLLAVMTRVIK